MNTPGNPLDQEGEGEGNNLQKTSHANTGELVGALAGPLLKSRILKNKEARIISSFEQVCAQTGLISHAPVAINSGVDDTVYFIGAPISVLKPYITIGNIPENGIFLAQPCIRSRNLTALYDDDKSINRGSTFTGMCALAKPEQLQMIADLGMKYLVDSLQIPKEHIIIRVSGEDKDLLEVAKNILYGVELEVDTKPDQYYNHKYGMNDIVGRNFNFAIKQAEGDTFSDVGNVIVIEDENKQYGVELALGASTILTQMEGIEHIMDISPISDVIVAKEPLYRKLQDCIVSTCMLLSVGEKPSGSNNKGRVLRSYMRGIIYLSYKLHLPDSKLKEYFKKYEQLEYGADHSMYEAYQFYRNSYIGALQKKGPVSEEDKNIYNTMR